MPYIIIDKDNNIVEVVATVEQANRLLKNTPGGKVEQVIPLELPGEINEDEEDRQ